MQMYENIFLTHKDEFNKLKKNGDRFILMQACPCHGGRGVIFAARSKNNLIINCSIDSKSSFKVKDYFKK